MGSVAETILTVGAIIPALATVFATFRTYLAARSDTDRLDRIETNLQVRAAELHARRIEYSVTDDAGTSDEANATLRSAGSVLDEIPVITTDDKGTNNG